MKCDWRTHGGWRVRDHETKQEICHVLWIDPSTRTYCVADQPIRIPLGSNEVAQTEVTVKAIHEDSANQIFWLLT